MGLAYEKEAGRGGGRVGLELGLAYEKEAGKRRRRPRLGETDVGLGEAKTVSPPLCTSLR